MLIENQGANKKTNIYRISNPLVVVVVVVVLTPSVYSQLIEPECLKVLIPLVAMHWLVYVYSVYLHYCCILKLLITLPPIMPRITLCMPPITLCMPIFV